MSDLFGNHTVGFPPRRLRCYRYECYEYYFWLKFCISSKFGNNFLLSVTGGAVKTPFPSSCTMMKNWHYNESGFPLNFETEETLA